MRTFTQIVAVQIVHDDRTEAGQLGVAHLLEELAAASEECVGFEYLI